MVSDEADVEMRGMTYLSSLCVPSPPVLDKGRFDAQYVQLWFGGPYWADRNIGAKNPSDSGLYFWWGDTIGYSMLGGKWEARDGSSSDALFTEKNTPTYGKSISDLQNEGWIVSRDGKYVLAPEHDAAHVLLGGDWRMPTGDDFAELGKHCDIKTAFNSCIVQGRGAFSSRRIFLPASGWCYGDSIISFGLAGTCWSSSPFMNDPNCADAYTFLMHGKRFARHAMEYYFYCRYFGQPIRPVLCPSKANANIRDQVANAEDCESRGKCNQDCAKTVEEYRKEAEQGNAKAQFALGVCYVNGRGVTKDYDKAIHWFRLAAEQGLPEAQHNLAVSYVKGNGVEKNINLAREWFDKAILKGCVEATEKIALLDLQEARRKEAERKKEEEKRKREEEKRKREEEERKRAKAENDEKLRIEDAEDEEIYRRYYGTYRRDRNTRKTLMYIILSFLFGFIILVNLLNWFAK